MALTEDEKEEVRQLVRDEMNARRRAKNFRQASRAPQVRVPSKLGIPQPPRLVIPELNVHQRQPKPMVSKPVLTVPELNVHEPVRRPAPSPVVITLPTEEKR